jgi:microcystin-dependent protein
MTVTAQTPYIVYTASGSTTVFAYPFRILDGNQLKVRLGAVLQVGGYTISGIGAQGGGNVTFAVAPLVGVLVSLVREVPVTQLVDYQPFDAFPAETHEQALDKLTMIAQEQSAGGGDGVLSLRLPSSEAGLGYNTVLPPAANRASQIVAVDSLGNIITQPAAEILQNDTPPSPPLVQGNLWYDSNNGQLYFAYNNPDNTKVLVGVSGVGGNYIPAAGLIGLTGMIFDFGGTVAPAGFLLCDGASYATAVQVALFAAIGYTWGGAGANFNVPDLRRRATIGAGGVQVSGPGIVAGNVGGVETHVLVTGELASHSHGVTDPTHGHGITGGGAIVVASSGSPNTGGAAATDWFSGGNIGLAGTGISIVANGSNTAHNNMQPSAVVTKIIKT